MYFKKQLFVHISIDDRVEETLNFTDVFGEAEPYANTSD